MLHTLRTSLKPWQQGIAGSQRWWWWQCSKAYWMTWHMLAAFGKDLKGGFLSLSCSMVWDESGSLISTWFMSGKEVEWLRKKERSWLIEMKFYRASQDATKVFVKVGVYRKLHHNQSTPRELFLLAKIFVSKFFWYRHVEKEISFVQVITNNKGAKQKYKFLLMVQMFSSSDETFFEQEPLTKEPAKPHRSTLWWPWQAIFRAETFSSLTLSRKGRGWYE